ncbi:uncharacterized protein [Arachis hypogaea]|uniref:uncharacterized protein n=1 Tax=Arachis hypogaea TaxID=3818 RepID=UPI003B22838E
MAPVEWFSPYPSAMVTRLQEISSDHAQLFLDTCPPLNRSKRRFKFQKRWCGIEEVRKMIIDAWNSQIEISPMFILAQKLKIYRYSHVSALEKELEAALLNEESYWRDKSKIRQLQLGDWNTDFFHQYALVRNSNNKIWKLMESNSNIVTSRSEIVMVAEDYYKTLFMASHTANPTEAFDNLGVKVTAAMNRKLVKPIGVDEVLYLHGVGVVFWNAAKSLRKTSSRSQLW